MSRNTTRSATWDGALDLEHGLEALRASPEFRGPVESLDGRRSTDHLASIYETREEQFAAAIPFVKRGLERGERCMYIADENDGEEVLAAMRANGIDADAALESGALTIHTAQETYLRSGEFDPDDMIAFLGDAIEAAAEEYEGIRITGEMTWVLGDDPDLEALMEYEAKLNAFFPDVDAIALCQYSRERFPPEVIRDVVRTHPHLVYDGRVTQNFYYTPPEEFFGPDQPSHEVDRMLGTLRERTEAKTALEEHERYLREGNEITSDPELSFDEKLDRLLALGCDRFGVDIGMLTREHEESFEITKMHGSHPELDEGTLTPPMTENYCRRVVSTGRTLAVADAGAAGWEGDALYHEFGLRSYAGVQVVAGDQVYGTICFTGLSPRTPEFTDAERTFLDLLGQWVSYELERDRREDHLGALNGLARELTAAETAAEASECVVETAETTLDLPLTAIALYDEDRGALRPAARTDAATELLEATDVLAVGEGAGWKAFVEGEPRREPAPRIDSGAAAHPPVTEVATVPMGNHGVFVTGSTASGGFSPTDIDFAETVAANAEAALDRVDRERQLQEREAALSEQNESLERLSRVNDIIRSIDRALVSASSRRGIEEVICERLAGSGPYELAWIGEHDGVTDEVAPREWAGAAKGYLEQITVTADDEPTGQGPTGEAVKTREPQVVNDVLNDDRYGPWRQAALNRGYHASIALPLVYNESMYGVLNVYAGRPNVFDDLERAVLTELSDTIAYAMNAVESKRALLSEGVVELEFRVRDPDLPFLRLVNDGDCRFESEGLIPQSDGPPRFFFTVGGAPPERVLEFADRSTAVDRARLIAERDGENLFGCVLTDESFVSTLLDHSAVPRSITAEGDTGTVVVDLPHGVDVRTFSEMLRTKHPGSELVARQEQERSVRTTKGFKGELEERLTDRQQEVLQTAYFSGFFESPRESTGQDIGDALGVSQPTINHHLRTSQRKFLEMLYGTRR